MEIVRFFEEPGIIAGCYKEKDPSNQFVELDEKGVLGLKGIIPKGLILVLGLMKNKQIFVAQRDLSRYHGEYFQYALSPIGGLLGDDFETWVLNSALRPKRAGNNVWMPWKGDPYQPGNKVDCWVITGSHVDLFQVGIITHDDGVSFRLLALYRWRGTLYESKGEIVGKPDTSVWGAFGARREILGNRQFCANLPFLSAWKGSQKDLDPPLGEIPDDLARVQWYSPFAGQKGLGPATLSNGSTGWVHGNHILNPRLDTDGVAYLQRGDLISFSGTAVTGEKNQTILLNVELKNHNL